MRAGVQLVQLPTQPALQPGALGDEVAAVVGEQLDLPRGPVQLGGRQVGLAQRGVRDRQRSSRSDLPGWRSPRRSAAVSRAGTRTTACPARSRSPSSRRVRCRQSSTANSTKSHCAAHSDDLRRTLAGRRQRPLREPAADLVDRHERVRPPVRVDAHHDPPHHLLLPAALPPRR